MNDISFGNMTLEDVCGQSGKSKQVASPRSFDGKTERIWQDHQWNQGKVWGLALADFSEAVEQI